MSVPVMRTGEPRAMTLPPGPTRRTSSPLMLVGSMSKPKVGVKRTST